MADKCLRDSGFVLLLNSMTLYTYCAEIYTTVDNNTIDLKRCP